MTAHALPPDERDLMRSVLMGDGMTVNHRVIASGNGLLPRCRDLAARGFMAVREAAHGCWTLSVTNLGARALIQTGDLKARDLADGAPLMLSRLAGYRRVHEVNVAAKLADRTLGDLSWSAFADTPHNRAAANLLLKRGHVERREPATDQERQHLTQHLILRATDEGMKA